MNQPHPRNGYEGYLFFKADPLPGQRATWLRVERTPIHATQAELYGMIYDRAFEISAAGQYQALSDERRAHVNQLIHDRRHQDPSVEWSCAYAKEHRRVVNDRDTVDRGHGTVAMTVILMQRPWTPKDYARTPMGDLIDLRMSTNLNGQGQYVRAATTSGLPVGHMLPRDFAMSNAYQIPKPPQIQERHSRTCLLEALSGRRPKTVKQPALVEGSARAHMEQDSEDVDDSEETDSDEDKNCGCDGAQNIRISGEKTRDTRGCVLGRGRQALQRERPKQDRRLAGPHVAAVYKSQMPVRRMRPKVQKASRKWIEARLVARKARLHRLQKLLEPAIHEQPRSKEYDRLQRRNSY